jgi:FRG domain
MSKVITMKETLVSTYKEFHEIVQSTDPNTDIFRGVLDSKYELIPKLGRQQLGFLRGLVVAEERMLSLFKNHAIPYLQKSDISIWELLAIAQHHGLPTRLLDWSRNPLVAAYFAVEVEASCDSAVYVLKGQTFIDIESASPFAQKEVSKYIPLHITPRITAQSALFTVHPDPTKALNSPSVEKLVIQASFRRELKKILYRYGIHRAALFPGLDGLAAHIQWLNTDSH